MATDKPKKPDDSARPGASPHQDRGSEGSAGKKKEPEKRPPTRPEGRRAGAPSAGPASGSTSNPGRTPASGGASAPTGSSTPSSSPGSGGSSTQGAPSAPGVSSAAGATAQRAVQGKNGGSGRRAAGRYAGAAASGAASGAKGGAPGAAAGAAKKVGTEGAKDAAKGAKKATGGSPVAKPAGQSGSNAGRGSSSAGGLSSGGSPTTGASGRGTKSLGGASASTSGQGGSAGSAGQNGSASKVSVGSPGTGSQQGSAGSQDASAQAGGRGAPTAQGGAGQPGASEAAEKTTKAADAAGAAGKAAGAADTAKKAAKSLDGIAAGAAGGAAQKAVEGDGSSAMRRGAGRYAGAAASGAVAGAQAGAAAGGVGALPGAAIGAAKNVGLEGGKDAVEGASKVTGGGPDAEPADKRLGAGGTGYERRDKKDGELVSKTAKGVAVGGAAAAAPPAMGLVMLMALLKWLKTMFFAMLAMAANAANLVWGFIVGVAKAVGHAIAAPFVAIGGLVGKAAGAVFGVAVTATVAPVATAASGVVATITAVAVLSTVATGVLNQGGYDDGRGSSAANCFVNVGTGGPGADVPANTEANAQAVYSVLKSWGMPDENIAGILGNWSQESGVDPTSVESIYDEPYQIGPRKQAAWDGNFTHIPGQEHGGIGLGQWSNGRTPMLLDYAQSKGVDWYTIETQLAFMVEGDNPSDVAVFKDMITTSQGSPAAAAKHFHDKWERSADNAQMMQERVADAEMWYGKMSGWSVDDSVAGGVEDIVGDIVDTIGGGINTILGNCDSDTAGPGGLVDGGMNEEQAQQLVDLYNEEGDKFLDEKYGNSGGPGSCGDNHAMNCVSFSTYFMNKYTSFQQYAPGNGIRTAYSIAEMTGKQMQDNPVPYSVGSGPGSGPAGHTLVVLGVDGDKVIVGEAGYCSYIGRVRVDSAARLKAEGWKFVDVSDLIGEGGSDPDMLPAANNAPQGTSSSEAVNAARSQIGKPYVWGGGDSQGAGAGRQGEDRGEIGFDCSGLTSYAVFEATGKKLPRTSSQQRNAGTVIPQSEAKPGDLVWWPGHIGIYAGGDAVIHASHSSNKVVESGLWGSPTFIRV